MNLVDAIQHAIDGNAVLFLGSGFSFGATGLGGDSPLSGRQLAKYLYEKSGVFAEDTDLAIASQCYTDSFGSASLAKLCREMFTIKTAAKHHQTIVSLPWQRIYTTNYDDLAEKSAVDVGKVITGVTPEDSPERFISSARICLHINGLINRVAVGDVSSSFKLTFESYLTDAMERSGWLAVFRQDLRLARAVVFVGYSMYDLDIARIVMSEDIKDKTVFVVAPDLKDKSADALRLPIFGELYKTGVINFAELIDSTKNIYTPKTQSEEFLALERVQPKVSLEQVSNINVEKLFLYGEVDADLLHHTSDKEVGRYYVLDRSQIKLATQQISSGSDLVVTADLGNGKTVALDLIASKIAASGVNVFRVTDDSKVARKEAVRILDSGESAIFLIDNYIPFLDFIDFISVRRIGKDVRFLLSSRTHVHDVFLDRLEESLRVTLVPEINIDLLENGDTRALASMIDMYGLWSDFSDLSESDRLKLINEDCSRQFHQVLLKLYKSPQMAKKISELFDQIRPAVRKVVIAIFIIKTSGLELTRSLVDELLHGSPLARLSNNDRESVRFLWSENGGRIRLRSSVLAEFYLNAQSDASVVVSVLEEMFEKAEIHRRGLTKNNIYGYFLRSVMTYSALQKMLPTNGLRPAVITFYESIQNTAFAKKNPHYWLQYAIARLALEDEDFEKIEQYFRTAYSYAKLMPNYDTYQIDNHFARFKLQNACKVLDHQAAFEMYKKAKPIVQKQMLREQKHQPYRAASVVVDFARIHSAKLDSLQVLDIMNFCDEIVERIDKLKMPAKRHKQVVRCRSEVIELKEWLTAARA